VNPAVRTIGGPRIFMILSTYAAGPPTSKSVQPDAQAACLTAYCEPAATFGEWPKRPPIGTNRTERERHA